MERLERARPEPKPRGAAPRVSLRTALTDRNLLGSIISGASWLPWRSLLLAAMGEKLTTNERRLFRTLTGRDHEPNKRVRSLSASSVGVEVSHARSQSWPPISLRSVITRHS
jgi:hypothetical protein